MKREAAYVNMGREVALIMLIVLMMSGIAAVLIVVPPQLPIDDTVTIAPYDHYDYNRTLPAGRSVNIDLRVLEGAPIGSVEFLRFSIMDFGNYSLKMSGSQTYFTFYHLEVYSRVNIVWQVASEGLYFFVLENPNGFNIKVSIKIHWELEWLPSLYAVIVLSLAVVTSAIVRHVMYARGHAPEWVELRGDLLLTPDVVTHAPEKLDYIIITGPAMKKCVRCERNIPVASEECGYCGAQQLDRM